MTICVDVPARGVTSGAAGRVGEYHHREFQAFGFMHGHHPHALGPLLDDWGLIGLAALGIRRPRRIGLRPCNARHDRQRGGSARGET
jgi:hypothetical protein